MNGALLVIAVLLLATASQSQDVDGGFSLWSEWTSCSKTCGGGVTRRTRQCDNPKPQGNGKDCSNLGPAEDSEECGTQECISDVDGGYSLWSEWTSCSKTCGGGVTRRTRQCDNPKPQGNGKDCSNLGPAEDSEECGTQECIPDVDGGFSLWSEWTSCSKTCGIGLGLKRRTRQCDNPKPQGHGKDCPSLSPAEESKECGTQMCIPDIDGGYSLWSEWIPCSKTCGGGIMRRSRECNNPKPQGQGKDCFSSDPAVESKECGTEKCMPECNGVSDVGIIIDGSGSVKEKNFIKTKFAVSALVDYFKVSPQGSHMAIIVYSTRARAKYSFKNSQVPSIVKDRILNLRYPSRATRTDRALLLAARQLLTRRHGARGDVPDIVIVFTDGKNNVGTRPISYVINRYYRNAIVTVAVGIGNGVDYHELLIIAQGNKDNVIRVKNLDYLKKKLGDIVEAACKVVDGGYSLWSEWTSCNKTCGGGVTRRTRQCDNPKPEGQGKDCSNLGPAEESNECGTEKCAIPECKKIADVGIIIDGSGSVKERNFIESKFAVRALVDYFKVSPQGSHMAIIVYSTRARVKYLFKNSQVPIIVKDHIMNLRYPSRGTRTDRALLLAARQLLNRRHGARGGVPDIVIVFTDGKNNVGTRPISYVINRYYRNAIETVAVGIGNGVDYHELLIIAQGKKDNVIIVKNFDYLKKKLGEIVEAACQ